MYNRKTKRGVAMIELIFALVIMGIVLMSAPMLIQQSARSGTVALQQEAIAATASHTAVILSMSWDENNTKHEIGVSPVLNTNRSVPINPLSLNGGALSGFSMPKNYKDMMPNNKGKYDKSGIVAGRMANVNGLTLSVSPKFGKDSDENDFSSFDDVDDYHNSNLILTIFNEEKSTMDKTGDYLDVDVNINTKIRYAEDRPKDNLLDKPNIDLGSRIDSSDAVLGGATNIKFIETKLTSNSKIEELNKSIVLKAFSCNIGTFVPNGWSSEQ